MILNSLGHKDFINFKNIIQGLRRRTAQALIAFVKQAQFGQFMAQLLIAKLIEKFPLVFDFGLVGWN